MAKKGLGRGLNALLGTDTPPPENTPENTDGKPVTEIGINMIEPNRKQPRKKFDADKLEALSQSISEHGLIQPIIITNGTNGMYVIIAGERRWRAAKKAGLKSIPAIIKDYSEIEAAQIALIENLQREDLNPIEEAAGYKALIEEYSLTQDEISRRIGKSRSAVANSLRLLSAGEKISQMLVNGELTTGHARALLGIEDQQLRDETAEAVVKEGLNVRQTEKLVKKISSEPVHKPKSVDEELTIQLENIAQSLCSKLGTKVSISQGPKKGKIEIEYYGNDDLERILRMLEKGE